MQPVGARKLDQLGRINQPVVMSVRLPKTIRMHVAYGLTNVHPPSLRKCKLANWVRRESDGGEIQ